MTNYQQLIADLETLVLLAKNNEFHDFKNKHFATPKVELVKQLVKIELKVKSGDYDQDDE